MDEIDKEREAAKRGFRGYQALQDPEAHVQTVMQMQPDPKNIKYLQGDTMQHNDVSPFMLEDYQDPETAKFEAARAARASAQAQGQQLSTEDLSAAIDAAMARRK